jgi:hypothetical protein
MSFNSILILSSNAYLGVQVVSSSSDYVTKMYEFILPLGLLSALPILVLYSMSLMIVGGDYELLFT